MHRLKIMWPALLAAMLTTPAPNISLVLGGLSGSRVDLPLAPY